MNENGTIIISSSGSQLDNKHQWNSINAYVCAYPRIRDKDEVIRSYVSGLILQTVSIKLNSGSHFVAGKIKYFTVPRYSLLCVFLMNRKEI